jgi:hypothetical protein
MAAPKSAFRLNSAMLGCLLCQLLLTGLLVAEREQDGTEESYLCQPSYSLDTELRGPLRSYVPLPGDIILSTDHSRFWALAHNLACTGHPHHSGIVLTMPDGRSAVLESGPHDTLHVEVLKLLPNLRAYEQEGPVWIRQRNIPLTPEQSARLTEFALGAVGKRFAVLRILTQVTPLRTRGPLRTWWVGGPHGDRRAYFCSELVLEACVAAGLLDPATTRPSATFPRDLFFDRSVNPFLDRYFRLAPCWEPPARWLSSPCSSGDCSVARHFRAPFNGLSLVDNLRIDPKSIGQP